MTEEKSAKAARSGKFAKANADAEALAGGKLARDEGFALYEYPDYDTYREV